MQSGPATNRLTSMTRVSGQRCRSQRSAHGSRDASFLAEPLAQHELLDLAARGTRELGDLPHVFGPLLAGQAARFEMRAHRLEVGRGRARLHAHERAAAFAEPRVGRADHRDLGDPRHAHELLLDLDRAHVLAAANDDVLLAVGDREVAVGVAHTDVAGHEPAVGRERLLR